MQQQGNRDAGDDDRAISRRHFLGASTAVGIAATAGCSGILGGGGGAGDPATAVEDFYAALNEGNAEEANSLIHPDSDAPQITEEQAQQFTNIEFSVESTEVLEQSEDRADVSVTLNAMGNTQTTEIELRTHDGQWKIWGEAI